MKFLGITITTKKELKEELQAYEEQFKSLREDFPFDLGQTVYDIALKNDKGRYTKTNPSLEYSTITPVVVDEKNYFKLVERYRRNDVFEAKDEAAYYIRSLCK